MLITLFQGISNNRTIYLKLKRITQNCRIEVRKELSDRWHSCPECKYHLDRDVASAQEICNRGYEQLSTQGLWGKEIGCQVGLSGAFSLDKWRRAAISNSDVGSPHHNL